MWSVSCMLDSPLSQQMPPFVLSKFSSLFDLRLYPSILVTWLPHPPAHFCLIKQYLHQPRCSPVSWHILNVPLSFCFTVIWSWTWTQTCTCLPAPFLLSCGVWTISFWTCTLMFQRFSHKSPNRSCLYFDPFPCYLVHILAKWLTHFIALSNSPIFLLIHYNFSHFLLQYFAVLLPLVLLSERETNWNALDEEHLNKFEMPWREESLFLV